MEQNRNRIAPGAATDEPASPVDHWDSHFPPPPGENRHPPGGKATVPLEASADPPSFEPPPLLSDCLAEVHAGTLEDSLESTLAETFPSGARKPRHDGWTPETMAGFLRHLAAAGVVDHAARAVGRSVASAYAFRNRRQGRAFASMWDAVLVHRARARVASELQGRAIAGCVSVRRKDGEIVSEYHYYDNRAALALLARLDRIAEREAGSEAHLRTLSEDLDDFCDCLEAGGDADAFVEARKPVPSEVEGPARPEPEPLPPDDDPEITLFARMAGCHHYRDVSPAEIEVRDLNPARRGDWAADQWVRAYRSGLMAWLSFREEGKEGGVEGREEGYVGGPGAPLCFHFFRMAARAAAKGAFAPGEGAEIDVSGLDARSIRDWTEAQLARGWQSGLMQGLPDEFWDDLAFDEDDFGAEE